MKNKLVEDAPYHPGYEDAGFKPGDFCNTDTQKPTAWIDEFGAVITHSQKLFMPELFNDYKTPLYTYQKITPSGFLNASEPVYPAKTLTDEEITAISKEIFKDYKNSHHYQIDFARAILKKAQEK